MTDIAAFAVGPRQTVVVAISRSEAAYEAVDGWLIGVFDNRETALRELAGEQWVEGEDYDLVDDWVRTGGV